MTVILLAWPTLKHKSNITYKLWTQLSRKKEILPARFKGQGTAIKYLSLKHSLPHFATTTKVNEIYKFKLEKWCMVHYI